MTYSIRGYLPDDAPVTQFVMTEAIRVTGSNAYSAEEVEIWLSRQSSPQSWRETMNAAPISYVAEDADGVFAFGTLYILYLMCHPRRARQGAATDILRALESDARKRGLDRLSTRAILLARPVFERCGFSVDAEDEHDWLACFEMSKPLKKRPAALV
jgi:putative acetyltransferase